LLYRVQERRLLGRQNLGRPITQEQQRYLEQTRAQHESLRGVFSAELAKAREAVDAAHARVDGAERRALLEIEQERQARGKVEKASRGAALAAGAGRNEGLGHLLAGAGALRGGGRVARRGEGLCAERECTAALEGQRPSIAATVAVDSGPIEVAPSCSGAD
jgi:hypothetical protein